MHCRHFVLRPVTRRDMLLRCANGSGALALAALMRELASDSLRRTPWLLSASVGSTEAAKDVVARVGGVRPTRARLLR
jgi:hypothetical protein